MSEMKSAIEIWADVIYVSITEMNWGVEKWNCAVDFLVSLLGGYFFQEAQYSIIAPETKF
jgi:hypothetical protein